MNLTKDPAQPSDGPGCHGDGWREVTERGKMKKEGDCNRLKVYFLYFT